MIFFLVDWVGDRAGIALLSPFSQARYSTVLNEKSTSLHPFFFRRAALDYCGATSTKWEFCYCVTVVQYKNANLNFFVFEFNVPRTNSSIKQLRGKNHEVATKPDQIDSILERLRYDQTGRCLSSPSPKG